MSVWKQIGDVSKTVKTPWNIVYHMLKLSDFALHLLLKDSLYLMRIKNCVHKKSESAHNY